MKPFLGRVPFAAFLVVMSLGGISSVTSQELPHESLDGFLGFEGAEMRGKTAFASSSFEALTATVDGHAEPNRWVVDAERVVLSWEHFRQVTLGTPLDPGADTVRFYHPEEWAGSKELAGARLVGEIAPGQAGAVLVRSSPSLAAATVHSDMAKMEVSGGERWIVGPWSNQSAFVSGDPDRRMARTHDVTPGVLVQRGQNAAEVTVHGTFTLDVWEARVQYGANEAPILSGIWVENATGTLVHPRGVMRDVHYQRVRVEATNGTFRWMDSALHARLAAESLDVTTDGRVRFEGARGTLATTEHVYIASGSSFEWQGRLHQTVSKGEHGEIQSKLDGTGVFVDLAPSYARPVPHSGRGESILTGVALGAAATVLVALSAVAARRWRRSRSRRRHWPRGLEEAQQHLVEGRPEQAAAEARLLLRHAPVSSPDVWFVYGAALCAMERFETVVREVGRVVDRIDDPSRGLSFLLSLAEAHRGHVAESLPWALKAAQDPELAQQIRELAVFEPVRKDRRLRRALGLLDVTPAYA